MGCVPFGRVLDCVEGEESNLEMRVDRLKGLVIQTLLVLRVDRVQRSFLGRLFEQYVYYVGLSLFVYFLCT